MRMFKCVLDIKKEYVKTFYKIKNVIDRPKLLMLKL